MKCIDAFDDADDDALWNSLAWDFEKGRFQNF